MTISPSPDNYTLGKGRVLFEGRDLGNVPEFTTNISFEKIQHYTSRSGMKKLDKTIITSVTPKATFAIEEMSADNVAMALLADTEKVTQAAEDITGTLSAVSLGLSYKAVNDSDAARKFRIGINKLVHGTVTNGPFTVDETITGGTSSATAVITRADTGQIVVDTVSGTFVSGETITGGTSSATAVLSSAMSFDSSDLVVSVSSTVMTQGTDYSVDGQNGFIKILTDGSIAEGDDVIFIGTCEAYEYTKFLGFTQTSKTGELIFIPDVPEGNNIELNFHKVDLTPNGDLSSIGEEIIKVTFEAEILDDSENNPNSPYLDAFIDDVGI